MQDTKQFLLQALGFEESATLLGLKGDGLHEKVHRILLDKESEITIGRALKRDTAIHRLHLGLVNEDKATNLHHLREILNLPDYSPTQTPISKNKQLIFTVEDLESQKEPHTIINFLDLISLESERRINFVYLFEDLEVFINLEHKVAPDSSFFQNLFILPLEDNKERETLQHLCEKQYKQNLKEEKLVEIFEKSHSHYQIYKMLYKTAVTGNSETISQYLTRLTESIGENSLIAIRKVLNNIELDKQEREIIDLYQKLGLLVDNKLSIPLLSEKILSISPKLKLIKTEEENTIITHKDLFTKKELALIQAFASSPNEIVTKEQLGEAIWQENFHSHYSPWAIDQLVFRTRMKLKKHNFNFQIKTIHGKGYILSEA